MARRLPPGQFFQKSNRRASEELRRAQFGGLGVEDQRRVSKETQAELASRRKTVTGRQALVQQANLRRPTGKQLGGAISTPESFRAAQTATLRRTVQAKAASGRGTPQQARIAEGLAKALDRGTPLQRTAPRAKVKFREETFKETLPQFRRKSQPIAGAPIFGQRSTAFGGQLLGAGVSDREEATGITADREALNQRLADIAGLSPKRQRPFRAQIQSEFAKLDVKERLLGERVKARRGAGITRGGRADLAPEEAQIVKRDGKEEEDRLLAEQQQVTTQEVPTAGRPVAAPETIIPGAEREVDISRRETEITKGGVTEDVFQARKERVERTKAFVKDEEGRALTDADIDRLEADALLRNDLELATRTAKLKKDSFERQFDIEKEKLQTQFKSLTEEATAEKKSLNRLAQERNNALNRQNTEERQKLQNFLSRSGLGLSGSSFAAREVTNLQARFSEQASNRAAQLNSDIASIDRTINNFTSNFGIGLSELASSKLDNLGALEIKASEIEREIQRGTIDNAKDFRTLTNEIKRNTRAILFEAENESLNIPVERRIAIKEEALRVLEKNQERENLLFKEELKRDTIEFSRHGKILSTSERNKLASARIADELRDLTPRPVGRAAVVSPQAQEFMKQFGVTQKDAQSLLKKVAENDLLKKTREGKQLTGGEVRNISDGINVPSVIDQVLKLVDDNSNVWPEGRLGAAGASVLQFISKADVTGAVSQQRRILRSNLDAAIQQVGGFLEGGKLTDADFENKYKPMFPIAGEPKAVAKGKIEFLGELVKTKVIDNVQALKESGFDTSAFEQQVAQFRTDIEGGEGTEESAQSILDEFGL